MAYTIIKTDGTILTTIADGTINTSSTSIGLPGRNYAGYGNVLDTNMVHLLENFANTTVPANPLRGQLWCDISGSSPILRMCPTDGETDANNWIKMASSVGAGTTNFGNITVSGTANIGANLNVANTTSTDTLVANNATINANLTASQTTATTANLTKIFTSNISTIGNSATLNGNWTITSSPTFNANLMFSGANVGIKTDYYYYANGQPFNPAGTYSNTNVASYLTTYNANVGNGLATFYGATLTTGNALTSGTITGNWTLSANSRLNSTYADLAERFAADDVYEPGTVVELGGDKEITMVQEELSESIFGVISNTAGYVMNGMAGSDETHPPVAVTGRVQVKVKGRVKKNDRLVSAGKGYARAAEKHEITPFNTIGRALANKDDSGLGTVEAIVILR